MAEELKEFTWEPRPNPRNRKYPWEAWLNGEMWELRKGRDYQCTSESFRSAASYAADKKGKKIETRILRDAEGERVVIRAYEDET